MAQTTLSKGEGKARAESPAPNEATSSAALTPPRTPPRRPQPPVSTPTSRRTGYHQTPSSSTLLLTPSSKRKSQARITSFFPNKKQRACIETIPDLLSPAEKSAAKIAQKAEEEDIKLLIQDIEKEEREEEAANRKAKKAKKEEDKAERAAQRAANRQLKREEKLAADQKKANTIQGRDNWTSWCSRNARPDATFQAQKRHLHNLHRNVGQCRAEFKLARTELDCLEHCSVENPINPEYTNMRMYRLKDVERLVGRKEAMLAGIKDDDEEDLIARGWLLFTQKRMGK